MVIITDKIFKYSKKSTPDKKEQFKVVVTANTLNIRTWAGTEHKTCSFSPLHKNVIVSVCDCILSESNKLWYYIKHNKKYGFISSEYTQKLSKKEQTFLTCLENIHTFVKNNPKYFEYRYDNSLETFDDLKNRVKNKRKVGLTCLVPMKLAFKECNLKRKDGKSTLIGFKGSFKETFTGTFPTYLTRITKGQAIGKTVKQAVDAGLLNIGDTICFENMTHTFTYTGKNYTMYDGGHNSIKKNVYTGIKANYKNVSKKIAEIIRWKQGV